MRNYEVTFIVDPVLSGDEIKSTASAYDDFLKNEKCKIVQRDDLGLKQLAYPINKRSSGVYFCTEFQSDNPNIINLIELALRRDERIMRFLTIKLDKYGIKYNDDKRNGKIGKSKKTLAREAEKIKEKQKLAQKPLASASKKPRTETPVNPEDDLTKIEGVGPVIAKTLVAADIGTYRKLAEKSADEIINIINSADANLSGHDPSTWSKQAQLAADGKWDELKTLQDELDGGKIINNEEE